jgi:hypothetical protein
MAFFQIPAPDLSNLSLGGAVLRLLESYGFSADDRYIVVRGTFTDAGDPSFGLHYGFWLFDTQTKEYVSNYNGVVAGSDNAREIDVLDVQTSGTSDNLFSVALIEEKGTGDKYLVSIQDGVLISSDLVREVSGEDIEVSIEQIALSSNGRFLAIQTTSEQLAAELEPDTNDSSDIYLLDISQSQVTRVSFVGGSEVTDPTHLKDIRINDGVLEVAFITDAAFVSPSRIDTNSGEINAAANARSDVYVWSSSFDETGLTGSSTFSLASIDLDGRASGFVESSSEVQLTQSGVIFTSSAETIVANDNNNAPDVFILTDELVPLGLTITNALSLEGGALFASASDSGRYVSFLTTAPEYSGASGAQQLVRLDTEAGTFTTVSENGEPANDFVINGVVSSTGLSSAFTSAATNLSSAEPAASAGGLFVTTSDAALVSGQVYHWKNHALLDDVTLTLEESVTGSVVTAISSENGSTGSFAFNVPFSGDKSIVVNRDLAPADQSRVVNSLDALAALKIAVGFNPNADDVAVSPYQLIAADVNEDGRINSLDALNILKMAVGLPGAIPQEWLFANEGENFWDPSANGGEGAFTVNRNEVEWNSDGVKFVDPLTANVNVVGFLLGDVDGSWSAPESSTLLAFEYFQALDDAGVGPVEQWHAFPIP